MKIQFVPISDGEAPQEFEMTPCSAVPRKGDRIMLPIGPVRSDGARDLRSYDVRNVIWAPSENYVKILLLRT